MPNKNIARIDNLEKGEACIEHPAGHENNCFAPTSFTDRLPPGLDQAILRQLTAFVGRQVGGWRLIRTLGGKFYKIRPIDGFSSQLASAAVILGASLVGGPVSTTQVVSSAIMGVGSAERANKVRWGVAQEIAMAWLLTIPATALVAAGSYWILTRVLSVS